MEKVTRRAVIGAAGAAALIGVTAALNKDDEEPVATGATLRARRIAGPVPADDPAHDEWGRARPMRVPLLAQQLAPPALAAATVPHLLVDALHDGAELGLRLRWEDEECDDVGGLARFGDAVAVQLPARARAWPAITMGAAGAPVRVVQWRAAWQRDIDAGRAGVEQIYPRVVRDLTPQSVLGEEVGGLWSPGREVANPISAAERTSPVEEMVAEGFGSLTHLETQRARGRGVWEDGGWSVALALPLDRAPAADPLAPGSLWPVAFAVWAGSAGNRGGRKHYADWRSLALGS